MISHIQVQTVTLIPGDGIGPEISAAVMKIFDAAKVSGLDTHLQRQLRGTFSHPSASVNS